MQDGQDGLWKAFSSMLNANRGYENFKVIEHENNFLMAELKKILKFILMPLFLKVSL
jgi:hypothetical protein